PFIVGFEVFNTETTEGFADIVLPATCILEEDNWGTGFMQNFNHAWGRADWCYHIAQRVVEPMAERRSAHEVGLDILDRLGQAWGRVKYEPNLLRGDLKEAFLEGAGLATASEIPFLRPSADGGQGEWILEFVSPYILVDGFIRGELLGGESDVIEVAFRSQVPKRFGLSEPDKWKPWKVLASKPGPFRVGLDIADSAEGSSSFHGTYRYQMRFRFQAAAAASQVGLADFGIVSFFENGIMSIPQIFAGGNTIRFKVGDAAEIQSDIYVTYTWEDRAGEPGRHTKQITPELFFKENEAVYTINAPKLWRCNSLVISYP
ncbi:MAG: hypothetical protein ACWGQW_24150, partial [bacterium]